MRALQILFLICASNIFGQSNNWTSFYSYDQITGVRYGKDKKVYAASNNNLFSYDLMKYFLNEIAQEDSLKTYLIRAASPLTSSTSLLNPLAPPALIEIIPFFLSSLCSCILFIKVRSFPVSKLSLQKEREV